MSPFVSAAADDTCHQIAKGSAEYSGETGEAYANHYMDAYNACVAYTELQEEQDEEEIIH